PSLPRHGPIRLREVDGVPQRCRYRPQLVIIILVEVISHVYLIGRPRVRLGEDLVDVVGLLLLEDVEVPDWRAGRTHGHLLLDARRGVDVVCPIVRGEVAPLKDGHGGHLNAGPLRDVILVLVDLGLFRARDQLAVQGDTETRLVGTVDAPQADAFTPA